MSLLSIWTQTIGIDSNADPTEGGFAKGASRITAMKNDALATGGATDGGKEIVKEVIITEVPVVGTTTTPRGGTWGGK